MLIHPIILAGGAGSRLWPLSREHYPKPLLALLGENTLLQSTLTRLNGLPEVASVRVVCNEEHRFLIAEQLRQLGITPSIIILEPVGRNTAPALTLAALSLQDSHEDAVMLVMPADHAIQNTAAFHSAIEQGRVLAEQNYLVTFGIVPDRPETGYGYIRQGSPLASQPSAHSIAAFVEKPDVAHARQYISKGGYLWNSGMFMMRASAWMKNMERFQADVADACRLAYQQGKRDGGFYRVKSNEFAASPSISIDHAVMEKTPEGAVLPLDAGWSDVGEWSSLWELCLRNTEGNAMRGDVLAHATRDSLLIAEHRCVAAVGLDNIIVVETADAVLVAHKEHAQQVKDIVGQLKAAQRDEYKTHRRVYRPWGSYESIDVGQRFQVKRLRVNAGAALSLQMHHHRAEHWIVVRGTAHVTRGDEIFIVSENESTYIPVGVKHRLENRGLLPLEMIEVQSGSYLGEDDIVRFEDRYDRDINP